MGGGVGGGVQEARKEQREIECVQLIPASVYFSWQQDKGPLSVTVSGETTLSISARPATPSSSSPISSLSKDCRTQIDAAAASLTDRINVLHHSDNERKQ